MFKFLNARFAALALLATMSIMPSAFAQVAAAAPVTVNQIDLSPWLKFLIAIATTSVPVFLGLVGTWAQSHFKVAKDSAASATIDLAVTAGQQFVASALAAAPSSLSISTKSKALADFMATLSAGTQAAMALRGTTSATVAQRIDGALTLALAPVAPIVSVQPPAPPPAPVQPSAVSLPATPAVAT